MRTEMQIRDFLISTIILLHLGDHAMAAQKIGNYSAETGKFLNTKAKPSYDFEICDTLSVAYKFLFGTASRSPRGLLPEVKPDIATFLLPGEKMKFVWFGHSTLLLNIDGQVLLVDPVFSQSASPFSWMVKRFQPAALKREELPAIDTIVISHDHYDHLDKETIEFFQDKKTQFVVPLAVGEHLRNWGIPAERIAELDWYDSFAFQGLTFTATPAHHFSGRGLFDQNETLWASWIIQGSKERIYFSGDSGYAEHFKEIGNRFGPFDVAFLENGQYNERWLYAHMMPEETVQAALDLQARTFVPVHWGMFDLSIHNWSEPVERSYKLAAEKGIPFLSPRLGEIVDRNIKQEFRPWWDQNHPISYQTENSSEGKTE